MTLIEQWRRAPRLYSVQLAAAVALLALLQTEVLPLFGFAMPPQVYAAVNAVLGVLGAVGRLVSQPGVLDQAQPTGAAPSGEGPDPDGTAWDDTRWMTPEPRGTDAAPDQEQ